MQTETELMRNPAHLLQRLGLRGLRGADDVTRAAFLEHYGWRPLGQLEFEAPAELVERLALSDDPLLRKIHDGRCGIGDAVCVQGELAMRAALEAAGWSLEARGRVQNSNGRFYGSVEEGFEAMRVAHGEKPEIAAENEIVCLDGLLSKNTPSLRDRLRNKLFELANAEGGLAMARAGLASAEAYLEAVRGEAIKLTAEVQDLESKRAAAVARLEKMRGKAA